LRLQIGECRTKSDAVTNISHDLRTPLTAISGYLDLLEQEETSPVVQKYLAVIRERTQAMNTLTEELFRYSVITTTSDDLSMEETCINDTLEVSLAAFYSVLTEQKITPEIQMSEESVIRQLDPMALRRIFGNILSNVSKYSDGDLRVVLVSEGEVSFSNHAKDLNKLQVQKLFDRFYTVENARTSTGLGLSIAKYLTEKMGVNH
jgi:signal transduction histidine kinase